MNDGLCLGGVCGGDGAAPNSALHGRRGGRGVPVLHLKLLHALREVLLPHLVLLPLGPQELGRLGQAKRVSRSVDRPIAKGARPKKYGITA